MAKNPRADRFISQASDITVLDSEGVPKNGVRYDNWRMPNEDEMHKEWLYEHNKMPGYLGTKKYNEEAAFQEAVSEGIVKRLPNNIDDKIGRRSHCDSIEELDDLLSTYASAAFRVGMPKRILKGFIDGDAIPMPIVFEKNNRMWIVGGNTRLDVARIAKLTPDPKIILVRV